MIPFPESLEPGEGAGRFSFKVEAAHPAFRGHFPEQPILPGVVQVDWALRLGVQVFGPLGTFQSLEHLKFQAVIRPEEPLELRLHWNAGSGELAFEYAGPAGLKSKGYARFEPKGPVPPPPRPS